ncbi:MAG: NUDIX hydrolase [Chloroflexota bacterium]
MTKLEKWTVESSTTLVDAPPFLTLRQERCRLPDGLVIPDYNVISEPDIVIALVMTRDKQVVLVEQYKHGIGEICLELPGGLSDGSDPLTEIQREVREETGYVSDNWQPLGRYMNNPTRFDNHIYSYIALDAEQVMAQHLDPAETIIVHTMSLDKVLEAVQAGRISAVHSIAVIYQALVHFKNLA